MSFLDEDWFSRIRRPSRYLGGEINSVVKDPRSVDVSVALAFPDLYEVGMSHLGLRILYQALNAQPWIAAERVFAPGLDLEEELRDRKIPLSTLESWRPVQGFDIVGFSLQHELSYTNVLNMLDLTHLPFAASQRGKEYPLVMAGGPACFNPEPVAEFFDAMVIGDGEWVAVEICRKVREFKQGKIKSKKNLLLALSKISGVYVPSHFRAHYKPDGTIDRIEPLLPGHTVVEKAILANLNHYPNPASQVVPFTELVHDRLVLEIARGCTRGCRFCQAGMIYRPVRERSAEAILEQADRAIELTGYEELSLLSLSSGDYSCLGGLLTSLMDRQAANKVAVSLPSLRVDSLSPQWVNQIKRVRKTGFTLAVEAGSERLRKVINKGLSQGDILHMARDVYKAGWNLIKLYFMVGLPGERGEDLYDIVRLAKEIVPLVGKGGKRPKLNVSVSTFVPKSHTPFMWAPQITLEESTRRIEVIRAGLRGARFRVKWNQPELSWLEGIFSRGDRKLNRTLIEAWRLGAKFDAWGENARLDRWKEAFAKTAVDPEFYLHRERKQDEILPWDHISCGVTKGYLKREWEMALREGLTADCRDRCQECGVCDHIDVRPVIEKKWDPPPAAPGTLQDEGSGPPQKYRLTFTKLDDARYLSHLEVQRVFMRALKRARIQPAYSEGYHPMPKLSFASALPVGTESLQETVDLVVQETLEMDAFKARVNEQLPKGFRVILVEELLPHHGKAQVTESHFIVTLDGQEATKECLERFLGSDHFPVLRKTESATRQVDARTLVESMELLSSKKVRLVLRHPGGPQLSPAEIVKAVFSLKPDRTNGMRILKTKQVLA